MALNARLSTILSIDTLKNAPLGTQTTLPGFDISITWDDVDLWMATIAPRISPAMRRNYITGYNVIDKVRRAKLNGDWPPSNAWID